MRDASWAGWPCGRDGGGKHLPDSGRVAGRRMDGRGRKGKREGAVTVDWSLPSSRITLIGLRDTSVIKHRVPSWSDEVKVMKTA